MDNLKVWGTNIEEGTIRQAEKAARLPILAGHVALMPDAHIGIGATVGSVIPTENAIIPAAVGVDIGCGMIAVLTNMEAEHLPDGLQPLIHQFSRSVPAGVGKRRDRESKGATDQKIRRK